LSAYSKPVEFDGFGMLGESITPRTTATISVTSPKWSRRHCLPFFPTLTSTVVIVSLPKMSTTFTAILRRPGVHS
jgi:hypothetical protein